MMKFGSKRENIGPILIKKKNDPIKFQVINYDLPSQIDDYIKNGNRRDIPEIRKWTIFADFSSFLKDS